MTLRVQGLEKDLGGRRVVEDVSFSVEPGRVVGLLGPNGAGKTTTFRMISGLLDPDAGTVELDGRELDGPLHRRVRAGLGYLPQHPALFEGMSVRAHLLVPIEVRGAPETEADALLAEAGLTELASARAETLSGGERRRLEIARCLATAPRVLLLDEPFAGVDPVSVDALVRRIRALADRGLGILLTDHAAREAMACCDEVVLLDRGRIVAQGTPSDIAADPVARERWLGPAWAPDSGD
ncbi:MAG: LPS export ABC transporter ATP-binding protein [Proteobacteria bacterium]|nr:LPS export ABC transporter ATP-binding protein [Pseudomonadota bacterium]MCP4921236.1 LPS export ABC transporter ATP-binding protein [Pseudomonadota bacterium]